MSMDGTLANFSSQSAELVLQKIFYDWQESLSARPRTLEAYTAGVARATPLIGALTGSPTALARISQGDAQAVYDTLCGEYSISTANLARAALSSLYRHAQGLGVRVDNPWRTVRERRQRVSLAERIMSEEDVQRLIEATPDGMPRLLVRLMYHTGARVSEALGIRGRDLRRTADGAWVVTLMGKGGKTRWTRLPPQLVAEIARVRGRYLRPDDRLFTFRSRSRAWQIVRRAARQAGLGPVSPHWLRHAHVSHALDHGVPLHVVKVEVGHSSIATTDRYTHVAPGAGSAGALPWV
jgi:integrase/recombinase XerD